MFSLCGIYQRLQHRGTASRSNLVWQHRLWHHGMLVDGDRFLKWSKSCLRCASRTSSWTIPDQIVSDVNLSREGHSFRRNGSMYGSSLFESWILHWQKGSWVCISLFKVRSWLKTQLWNVKVWVCVKSKIHLHWQKGSLRVPSCRLNCGTWNPECV